MIFQPQFPGRPPKRFGPGRAVAAADPAYGGTSALPPDSCFTHGRIALKYGLRSLDFPPGTEILLPDFICDVILPVLSAQQLAPVFFPVREDLTPDWDRLAGRLSANSRALLMVHYFGIPQAIDAYTQFCREHGLVLIEDNAHGYGGTFEGRLLGNFGDIGISSPWKNFPIQSGGILHLPDPQSLPNQNLPVVMRPMFPSLRRFRCQFRSGWLAWHRSITHDLQHEAMPAPLPDRRMHSADRDWLANQDLAAASAQRRAIYQVWESWCAHAGLKPLFKMRDGLPDGTAPLVYPALTSGPGKTREWFEWAFRHGIEASSWPKLPVEVFADQNSLARSLWERLVCFPIHQYMEAVALRDCVEQSGSWSDA